MEPRAKLRVRFLEAFPHRWVSLFGLRFRGRRQVRTCGRATLKLDTFAHRLAVFMQERVRRPHLGQKLPKKTLVRPLVLTLGVHTHDPYRNMKAWTMTPTTHRSHSVGSPRNRGRYVMAYKSLFDHRAVSESGWETNHDRLVWRACNWQLMILERIERWVCVCGVALCTALVAILVLWCVEKLIGLKNGWVQTVIDKDVGFFPPFLLFCGINVCLVLPVTLLVAYVEVGPGSICIPSVVSVNQFVCLSACNRRSRRSRSRGVHAFSPSSVTELVTHLLFSYLNCINMPRVIRLKTLLGKIICTILSVSGSMTLGPEGNC